MAQRDGYSRIQIALHWTIVALVLVEYASGELVEEGSRTSALALIHVWPGLAIIALMLLRLAIRLVRGAPPPPRSEPELLRRFAVWTHWAFYVLLIAIPGGAALDWYFGLGFGQVIHDVGEPVFFALVWIHIGAAAAHHFIFRTNVVRRMVVPERQGQAH